MREKKQLPLLPLKDPDVVIFPGVYCEIDVGRLFSINSVMSAKTDHNNMVLIGIQKSKDIEEPKAENFFVICCEAEIKSTIKNGDKLKIVVQGTRRGNLEMVASPSDYKQFYVGHVEFVDPIPFNMTDEVIDAVKQLREMIEKYLPAIPLDERNPSNHSELSLYVDNIAANLPIAGRSRLKLLR